MSGNRWCSILRAAGVGATLALAACGGGGGGSAAPGPSATPAPLTSPIVAGQALPPSGTIYLGGYINSTGLPHATGPSTTAAFESQIGRKLALDVVYHDFLTKFPGRGGLDDYSNGRIPVYSWNCGLSNAQVASGAADATLHLQAASIAAYGWPIFVRYMWDMNLPSTSLSRTGCLDRATDGYSGNFSPAQFIAAWQHIRQIFAQEGAVNAVWLWSVTDASNNFTPYYPGDSQVDWVSMDEYDTAGTGFAGTFSTMYAALATYHKPIMISETGAPAALQSTFFGQAAGSLKTQFPLVKAFVYYDAIGNQDWRIDPSAMSAFTTFAKDPYLGGFYAP